MPEQLTITQVAALQASTKDLSVASITARGEYDSKLRAGQEVFESAKAKLAACDGKLSAALVEQERLRKLVKELEGTGKWRCSLNMSNMLVTRGGGFDLIEGSCAAPDLELGARACLLRSRCFTSQRRAFCCRMSVD